MSLGDITLTTRQVADIMAVSTRQVLHDIESGMLLCARVRVGKDGRHIYKPTVREVAAYIKRKDASLLPVLAAQFPDAAA